MRSLRRSARLGPGARDHPRWERPLSSFLLFTVGLVVLLLGAEMLVRGASDLARSLGVPSVVVGLTVVSLGTSAPEVLVTIRSVLDGHGDIGLGNVLGSNVFNVLFILGLSAVVVPLTVSARLVRLDVPLMIGASGLVWFMARGGGLSRLEGGVLLVLAGAYTFLLLREGVGSEGDSPSREKASDEASSDEVSAVRRGHAVQAAFIVVGVVALALGASWLVDGAVEIAAAVGLPELVVGLTLLAVGTSLPEVAASVLSVSRGERDLAVGNVVGSNLYNLLLVLGLGSVLTPGGLAVPAGVMAFDLPIMTAVAVACLPIFFTDARIDRWEGALFLGYYGAYLLVLLLGAVDHALLPTMSVVMLLFVVPLTALTLALVTFRGLRKGKRGSAEPEHEPEQKPSES